MAHEMIRDVRDFMRIAGQDLPLTPTIPEVSSASYFALIRCAASLSLAASQLQKDKSVTALRVRFLLEELAETLEGLTKGDVVEVADGLTDLLYVTIGAELAFGLPAGPLWNAVADSNLKKFPTCPTCKGKGCVDGSDMLGAIEEIGCPDCMGAGQYAKRDEQGKVVKPEGWAPPDIAGVLAKYGGR